MKREQFYVVHKDGRWNVKHGEHYHGPHDSQQAAIDDAKARAKACHGDGRNAQVLVQGENGPFRTEWTYGEDPERHSG